GRGVSDIAEQHRDLLALPFQGAAGGEDPLGEVLRGISLGGGHARGGYWRRLLGQIVTTGVTEAAARWIHLTTRWAGCFELGTTRITEARSCGIRMTTLRTVHQAPTRMHRVRQRIAHMALAASSVTVQPVTILTWQLLALILLLLNC